MDLKPDHPFVEDYASCQMAIMPENFFSEADKRKIMFQKEHQNGGSRKKESNSMTTRRLKLML